MDYTNKYKLKKPAQEDYINIEDLNANFDIIDTQLGVGANAQALGNQLLTRVQSVEARTNKINQRSRIMLVMYGLNGVQVTLRHISYSDRKLTFGSSGKISVELEETGSWSLIYPYQGKTITKEVHVDQVGETVVDLTQLAVDNEPHTLGTRVFAAKITADLQQTRSLADSKARLICGTYLGDGSKRSWQVPGTHNGCPYKSGKTPLPDEVVSAMSGGQFINLGGRPKMVITAPFNGNPKSVIVAGENSVQYCYTETHTGSDKVYTYTLHQHIAITDTGFWVGHNPNSGTGDNASSANYNGVKYNYFAFV